MNLDILNMKGEKVGVYELPDTALELEKGSQAVKDTVVSFLNACRAGTASTKTRGQVSGGGRKPFKQKGLGRARSGSSHLAFVTITPRARTTRRGRAAPSFRRCSSYPTS